VCVYRSIVALYSTFILKSVSCFENDNIYFYYLFLYTRSIYFGKSIISLISVGLSVVGKIEKKNARRFFVRLLVVRAVEYRRVVDARRNCSLTVITYAIRPARELSPPRGKFGRFFSGKPRGRNATSQDARTRRAYDDGLRRDLLVF